MSKELTIGCVRKRTTFSAQLGAVRRSNYSINNSAMDLYLVGIMGVLGYVLVKLECPPAPLILGFVLGPLMEENLRRALLISRGDPAVFFTRPISAGFMIASALILILMFLPAIRRRKTEAYEGGGGDQP